MSGIECWLQSSLERVYPGVKARECERMALYAPRNGSVSFQMCVRNSGNTLREVVVSATAGDGLKTRVRRVGYVPLAHLTTDVPVGEIDGLDYLPGLAPDPLFPESVVKLGPLETQAFWVNVDVPADATPGTREVVIELRTGDETIGRLTAEVTASELVLTPRRDFPVTHWFYADALCDWYKCNPWDEKLWGIVEAYIADMVAHGNSYIYVPLFTPPTDGVKRPTQLLGVSTPSQGVYEFDWTLVRRWVRLAQRLGAEGFEWTHLFTQWGAANAIRIYRDNADETSLLWPPEISATSEVYRNFLTQFMPEFHRFLSEEGLLDCSVFHLSDEPHGDEHLANYRRARALLREVAPWMKVSDALSDIRFGSEGLTDNPIPSISSAKQYAEAGIPAWTYFCCGPRGAYLNRFVDTPLAKTRMAGWLFHKLGALGFLHWGYNYWYKMGTRQTIDPFTEVTACAWPGIAAGDAFLVYPGENGPIDSIRWEIFAESLQDLAILRCAGIAPDDSMLAPIASYEDFPKEAAWADSIRKRLLGGR